MQVLILQIFQTCKYYQYNLYCLYTDCYWYLFVFQKHAFSKVYTVTQINWYIFITSDFTFLSELATTATVSEELISTVTQKYPHIVTTVLSDSTTTSRLVLNITKTPQTLLRKINHFSNVHVIFWLVVLNFALIQLTWLQHLIKFQIHVYLFTWTKGLSEILSSLGICRHLYQLALNILIYFSQTFGSIRIKLLDILFEQSLIFYMIFISFSMVASILSDWVKLKKNPLL